MQPGIMTNLISFMYTDIDVSTSIGNLDETFVLFDLKSRKVFAEHNANGNWRAARAYHDSFFCQF